MKKTLLMLALAVAIAGSLVAQGPPPPGGPQGGPPPAQALVDILGFSDAQLAQFQQLLETRRTAAEALQRQISDAERALGEALQAGTPDAATVGAALLKVNGLHKQLAPIEEAFRTGIAGILTADQKTKLEAIRAVASAVQAAEALRRTGLL